MAIVLAAGQGTRMKSKRHKVLHPLCGKPMLGYVAEAVGALKPSRQVVIVGHGADAVRDYLGDGVEYALQERQQGTGHAVMQARPLLAGREGVTLVVCGDTPLIRGESLQAMIELHVRQAAAATVMTAVLANPAGYGRIVRDSRGGVAAIVEDKDCTEQQKEIREINTGTYCFDNRRLFEALEKVTNRNAQNEYYLTDVIRILRDTGARIEGWALADAAESLGINDRIALAEAEAVMRQRILRRHMLEGVTVIDPASTYVEDAVRIGPDTVLRPGTALRGATVIGADCEIGPNSEIADSTVGDQTAIKMSVLIEAQVGDRVNVGPFAYLRPGAKIGNEVKIGDFVEIKNAAIDDGSKVSHLSYIGDAKVGKNVNFGCGAITVNYDGFNKSLTEIADNAFVGSNVNLIAPVRIGESAYVVAGSTITRDVDADAMAIARERQTNKEGYAGRIRSRMKAKKTGNPAAE